jgi:hypothetical protein
MDHEEMRAAYMRALNIHQTDFIEFCNFCKNDYVENSGEITDLVTSNKVYKMWFCDECSSKEMELTC